MQMRLLQGSKDIVRCCLGLVVGLMVTGCNLSDEPIPIGPIETGPLPGQATREPSSPPTASATQPATGATPGQPTSPPSTSPNLVTAGIVTGTVRNGTDDASVPDGLEVELRGVTIDDTGAVKEFFSRGTQIDQENTFRFEDIPFDVPVSAYIVQAIYDGVEFANGVMVNPHESTLELPLMIYENTTDPAAISIDAMNLTFTENPDALYVSQVMVMSNAGDRVYVSPQPVAGGRRGSVVVPVPADAYGLTFEGGELGGRFVRTNGLIYDTQQVFPGQESHAITVRYQVPFTGPSQISLPIIYPTDNITILINEEIKVDSPVLTDGGTEVIREHAYHRYIVRRLDAGQSLDMRVESTAVPMELLRIALVVLTALLGVASVLYWLLSARKQGQPAAATAGRLSATSQAQRQSLLGQIAALDEALEAGKINRFEWEAQRAELKAELAELTE